MIRIVEIDPAGDNAWVRLPDGYAWVAIFRSTDGEQVCYVEDHRYRVCGTHLVRTGVSA